LHWEKREKQERPIGEIVTVQKFTASANPETILIIPFADGIGDFVNMQPILTAVSRRFPNASISVAASAYANYLNSPDNPVKIVTPSWYEKEPGPMAQRLRHLVSQKILAWVAGPALKRELGGNIDLLINTFYLWERHMDFPRYWTPQTPPRPGAMHTLDCLADVLESELGIIIPPAERFPHVWISPDSKEWAIGFIKENGLGEKPLVGIVAESNMQIKKWPASHWAYLQDSLQERGYDTVFFAPPNSELIQQISELTGHKPLVASTALDNVTALLEHCTVTVGVDTGLLHIASAIGTRWIGLFGPTNPQVTGPYDRSLGLGLVAPFHRGESCRNCWKSFKYEDDICLTLDTGSCIDFLDKKTVLDACIEMIESVKV
jgi:ADP-heptose:LPS heptosyltransferase